MWQAHLINVVFISQHTHIVHIDLQLRKHKERRIYNKDSYEEREIMEYVVYLLSPHFSTSSILYSTHTHAF